jgi:hypothetical protein
MITFLLLNKLDSLDSKPLFSFPAIGCAGTKKFEYSPKICLTIETMLVLVLPTSVINILSVRKGFISLRISLKEPTGVAITTISESLTASFKLVENWSIMFAFQVDLNLYQSQRLFLINYSF